MIASIIDDSRCEMSDVAFRTAPPFDGLSCFTAGSSLGTMKTPLIVCDILLARIDKTVNVDTAGDKH